MDHTLRRLMVALLAGSLIAGCGQKTELPALSTSAPKAAPLQQYVADDSACRWSYQECFACGGGGGEEYIAPVDSVSDAIVSELAGTSPAFSPDGEFVATVDGEAVRVWRAADGKSQRVLAGDAFVFSPDGRTLALQQADGWYLLNATTWEELYRLADRDVSLYFSADGSTIVTEGDTLENFDGSVQLYDAATGSALLALQDISFPTAISPDGAQLAAAKRKDAGAFSIETIGLWDTATGAKLQELQAEIQSTIPLAGMRGHREVSAMTFSPDGQALLSAGRDAVRLWDAASGQHLRCFQTPEHAGAGDAFWGADASTIIGEAVYEDAIYLWDANTNHPVAVLVAGEDSSRVGVGLADGAEGGSLLAWNGFNVTGKLDRNAYLWDLRFSQLQGVLPTTGILGEAALSPAGDRAATVSTYHSSDNPEEWSYTSETRLWDISHRSLPLTVAAQKRYWNALEAAIDGKPLTTQERFLRMARALSPELFADEEQLDEEEITAYREYIERLERLEALADHANPAAEAFYAEIQDTSPKWSTWSDEDLIGQVTGYMIFSWNPSDAPGLVAAYQGFAKLDPITAGAPEVVEALLEMIAPDATMLAQEGDIDGATALIQEVLAAYPDLDVEPAAHVRRLYAQVLVDEARSTAAAGDIAGAVTRFEEALATDPSLAIDPGAEANREYARTLVSAGFNAAWQGDAAGALASFEEALAFDPALIASPPVYAQISCALGPDVVGMENAAGVCADIGVNVATIAPGDTVAGTVDAGAIDFWSFDAATPTTVAIDMLADNSELSPQLYLIGPDGAIISENTDYLGSGGLHIEVALPEAGPYLVGAAGYLGASGDYRLTLSEAGTEP